MAMLGGECSPCCGGGGGGVKCYVPASGFTEIEATCDFTYTASSYSVVGVRELVSLGEVYEVPELTSSQTVTASFSASDPLPPYAARPTVNFDFPGGLWPYTPSSVVYESPFANSFDFPTTILLADFTLSFSLFIAFRETIQGGTPVFGPEFYGLGATAGLYYNLPPGSTDEDRHRNVLGIQSVSRLAFRHRPCRDGSGFIALEGFFGSYEDPPLNSGVGSLRYSSESTATFDGQRVSNYSQNISRFRAATVRGKTIREPRMTGPQSSVSMSQQTTYSHGLAEALAWYRPTDYTISFGLTSISLTGITAAGVRVPVSESWLTDRYFRELD